MSRDFFVTQRGDHDVVIVVINQVVKMLTLYLAAKVTMLVTFFISNSKNPQVMRNSKCFETIILNIQHHTILLVFNGHKTFVCGVKIMKLLF